MVKVKRIVAREGLIVIGLALASICCLQLATWQGNKFNNEGKRILNKSQIEKFNLFENVDRKVDGFDTETAIPVDSLPRETYHELAKKELLNRDGFFKSGGHFIPVDELPDKETATQVYLAKRELLTREMRTWSNEHLAAMSEISLPHFDKAIKKISYLKIQFSFGSLGIFFLVFAYPLYLLIRFIVWALKTLAQIH